MKDYSKVKFVKPSVDGTNDDGVLNVKKSSIYAFKHVFGNLGEVTDDLGGNILIRIKSCSYLNYEKWIPCDENGKELDNERV